MSAALAYPRKHPTIRPVPRKLFDKLGKEIKSVSELEYDQEIWLSFGEPWRSPYSQSLHYPLTYYITTAAATTTTIKYWQIFAVVSFFVNFGVFQAQLRPGTTP